MLCLVSPAGLEEYFAEVGEVVASVVRSELRIEE
jgi:hypothetical protein